MLRSDVVRPREGRKEWRCPNCDSDMLIKDRVKRQGSHWVVWAWCANCNRRLRIDKYGIKTVGAVP